MGDQDDPFAGLDGDSGGPAPEPSTGWRSTGGQTAFWIVAGSGALIFGLAWFEYGFAFFEEMTEECKSLAAGSSSAGIGFFTGGLPLVFVHSVYLTSLLSIGAKYHSRRSVGLVLALVAVAAASGLGIAVNQLLWAGELFTMSAAHAQCNVIDSP